MRIQLGKHWRRPGESEDERAPKRDEASRKLTEREMNTSGYAKHESAAKWDRPQAPAGRLKGLEERCRRGRKGRIRADYNSKCNRQGRKGDCMVAVVK